MNIANYFLLLLMGLLDIQLIEEEGPNFSLYLRGKSLK
ncbi:hypothetical protein J2S19_001750 [Metabacillus malikii]|uniref:Uncharacterized protein n=1 Tax=Metabacillus malikii TaxID=1504265 RepID=A0ABT9ZEZ5_9BACI|nr:hypothetical protein [Metabacillus malikii]